MYYIHTDQLNTPRLITNSANAKVWEWNNDDPFANNPPNDDPNATGNHFTYNPRLPGQYFDSETNTNYNYYQDYDPATGRYIESDPIGLAGGINTYGYVGGNPIGAVDPKGLLHWSGAVTMFSYGGSNIPNVSVGGFGADWVITSDCVRGQQAIVTVSAFGGFSSIGKGPKLGSGASTTNLEDGNGPDYINPYVFNGDFIAASFHSPIYTFGSKYSLGGAVGNWNGLSISSALEGSIMSTGNARVMSVKFVECACKK